MTIFSLIWTCLSSRFGGWVIGGLTVLIVLGLLKLEHHANEKVRAQLVTVEQYKGILEEQLKLYQEREDIKAKAAKKRGKINVLRQNQDYIGLVDSFNGLRQPLPANPQGSAKAPTKYREAGGAGPAYQEAR